MRDLPTGTVTFLFTDIEGSTRLLGELGEAYPAVLEDHHRLLREAVDAHDGTSFGTEGDALFAVFSAAPSAVAAAVAAQKALAGHAWPEGREVRVRMGLHSGEGVLGAGSYVGLDVHRTARIAAAGHGGQVLISEATRALVGRSLPPDVSLRDLGEHRLKDLEHPERLHQLVIPELPVDFPTIRTLDARRGNLPAQLTSFVGREREVAEVTDILGRTRLLTLTGPGGTGKTRLSLHVAGLLEETYADGAFFVPLGPLSDPMLVPTTIGQELGLREDPARTPLEALVEHLRDRQVLLVLDNFEQLLDAARVVGELLAGTTAVRVLVTSREALGIHGEQEYPVPPLALPDISDLPPLDALSQYEAVRLFVERAAAVRPGFAVTNENAPAVAEICTRLDGLPLAIELAAARVKLLSPEDILKRLGHRLELLSGGARDLPARQRTLRGAIDWSYDLLEEPEKIMFARLALFSGGFTLEALEAICGPGLDLDTFEGIASLSNKSLVRQRDDEHGGETRFFTLQTIWEYAAERFEELPDADELKARHAAFFLDFAKQAAPDLFGSRQAELLDRLAHEHDNFRTAVATSVERGDVETALLLAGTLWRYWQMRGHLLEASERVRTLVDLPDAERYPEALAQALEAAGGVHYWMADWERAEQYYMRCLELRRTLGDRAALAEAIYNLSFAFTVPPPPRQDLERGRELLREAEALFREVDDRSGLAKVLWGLGSTATVQNDWDSAVVVGLEAAELFRELGDRFSLGWALNSLGTGYLGQERLEEAREAFEEGLELFLGAGDVTGVGLLLGDLAVLAAVEGDHERGARLRGAALRVEEQSGQGLVTNLDVYMPWDLEQRRGPLSQEAWDRLVEEGGRLSIEEAAALALKRD